LAVDDRSAEQPTDSQWEGVLDLAGTELLLPALWTSSVSRGWFTPIPRDARAAIEAHVHGGRVPALLLQLAYEDNVARTHGLLAEGEVVLRTLADAGVAAIPLKGWHAILDGWWPDPAGRVLRDLDVLVPEADAVRARHALERAGFATVETALDDYADHQLPAMSSPDHPVPVEIHTSLAVSRWRDVLPAADVFRASRNGHMSTTHAIVHTIVHAQLHDEAHLLRHLPVRSVHEIAMMSRSPVRSSVDWAEVRARFASAGRRGGAALDAHFGLAARLFGAGELPAPRSPFRVRAHLSMCELELVSPGAARAYRATVFLPRAWGAARMHRLYGEGNVWRLRVRHLRERIKSGRAAGGSSASP
jgi:hypothetical protein